MMEFKTIEDVLEFAISLEQASQKFYSRLATQTQSPSVKHFLTQMISEETAHEGQLREMVDAGWEILVEEISTNDMDSYIDAMKIPEPLDYKEAVKLARDKENASRTLYTLLAGMVEQPELTAVLKRLALQEQDHYNFFQQEYRTICVGEN